MTNIEKKDYGYHNLKLKKEDIEKLERIKKHHDYKTRSKGFRKAIDTYIKAHNL